MCFGHATESARAKKHIFPTPPPFQEQIYLSDTLFSHLSHLCSGCKPAFFTKNKKPWNSKKSGIELFTFTYDNYKHSTWFFYHCGIRVHRATDLKPWDLFNKRTGKTCEVLSPECSCKGLSLYSEIFWREEAENMHKWLLHHRNETEKSWKRLFLNTLFYFIEISIPPPFSWRHSFFDYSLWKYCPDKEKQREKAVIRQLMKVRHLLAVPYFLSQ